MTAPLFDPEAIARRVFDAEHAAVEAQPEPAPAVVDAPYISGTGQTRGRPLPTEATGDGSDIFDRIERQREAKRIHSPIVLRDLPFEPTARTRVERAALEERYVAPPLVDDDDPVAEPARVEPTHDPRCGTPLTGGGAPRGWVLVRVIGSGAPRRYCSPTCAIDALSAPPAALQELVEVVAPPTPRRARRAPVPSTLDIPEIVRRYQTGQTAPEIGRTLGHTAGTIRNALDRAGIARRDDRSAHSGGQPKDYDPQLVARVRALYTLHKLTQAEVAEAIGSSAKVVQNIMARHDIEARPPANHTNHGHAAANNSKNIADRLRAIGVTSRDVKVWAHGAGLLDVIHRGTAPARLVDAYLAAHQNGASA